MESNIKDKSVNDISSIQAIVKCDMRGYVNCSMLIIYMELMLTVRVNGPEESCTIISYNKVMLGHTRQADITFT
jgi:hypothetical protein